MVVCNIRVNIARLAAGDRQLAALLPAVLEEPALRRRRPADLLRASSPAGAGGNGCAAPTRRRPRAAGAHARPRAGAGPRSPRSPSPGRRPASSCDRFTDTDVPWWDAFPTAASVLGQWLLGRKYVENWPVWIVVNVVGVGLFAYKGLWLTVVLYALFVAMSVVGWRAWRRLAASQRDGMSPGFVIALLGAESTGKTTLAVELGARARRARPARRRRRRGAARVLRPRTRARRGATSRRRSPPSRRGASTRPRRAPRSSSPTPPR